MTIESFYTLRARDFNKIANKLDRKLNDNNMIGHDKYRFAFRDYASQAKEWYDEVKFSAYHNNVALGNRKNFKEVLKEQIDNAMKENEYNYADYVNAISNFLEFYYK